MEASWWVIPGQPVEARKDILPIVVRRAVTAVVIILKLTKSSWNSIPVLLEQYIFNSNSIAKIVKEIGQLGVRQEEILNEEKKELQSKLVETEEAISNITQAIMSGLHSKALIEKLTELETEKTLLEAEILKLDYRTVYVDEEDIDPRNILNEYRNLKSCPSNPAFKYFLQEFIERIEVGRYSVTFVLRTGLGIFPRLDTTLTVRRQEIYEHKKIAA